MAETDPKLTALLEENRNLRRAVKQLRAENTRLKTLMEQVKKESATLVKAVFHGKAVSKHVRR